MGKLVTLSLALALAVLSASSVRAHHAFAAEFDANQPVEIRGHITRLEWINPHGWIYLDVKKADGTVEHWDVETGAPNALLRRGLRRTDFPIGVELVVKGYMSKRQKFVMNASSVRKADGTEYFVSSAGTGAPEP
jgi:WD40 repeat protein